jgi:microcystin-dependent protein
MSEPYLGELRIFTFGFPPKNWLLCNGQLLPIAQYQALFALLGTAYGGDGIRTFGVPNLQGAAPISWGTLPGGGSYTQGQTGGAASVTLTNNQTGHTHTPAAATAGANNTPAGEYPAGAVGVSDFATATDGNTMASSMVPVFGGNQPHNNMQPSLVVSVCICMAGIFPSRN